jgi:hypothetical protein
MNKQEAISFLKVILTECDLSSDSFVLIEPDPKDLLSTGYKLRIQTVLDNACRRQLRKITKKYDLAVVEEQMQMVVYKPKTLRTRI